MANPKILVFGGSLRTGSYSARLAALAAKEIAVEGADTTLISLGDYPLPLYDANLERESGIPENATKLARLIAAQDGVFIATPEYNHSLPPLLKNSIDWISRHKANSGIAYPGKVYAIGSTSDGFIGGARALIDLRKVLAHAVKAIVIAEQISVSRAQAAFDEKGHLADEAPAMLLKTVCIRLVELAGRLGSAA